MAVQSCLPAFLDSGEPDDDTEVQQEVVLVAPGSNGHWTVDGIVQTQRAEDLVLPTGRSDRLLIGFAPSEHSRFLRFEISPAPDLPEAVGKMTRNPFRLEVDRTYTRVEAVVASLQPPPPEAPTLDRITPVDGEDRLVVTLSDGKSFETDGKTWTRVVGDLSWEDHFQRLSSGSLAAIRYSGERGLRVDDLSDELPWFSLGLPTASGRMHRVFWADDGPSLWTVDQGKVYRWLWKADGWTSSELWGTLSGPDWWLPWAGWGSFAIGNQERTAAWTVLRRTSGEYLVVRFNLDERSLAGFAVNLEADNLNISTTDQRDGSVLLESSRYGESGWEYRNHRLDPTTGLLVDLPWLTNGSIIGSNSTQILVKKEGRILSWLSGDDLPTLVERPELPTDWDERNHAWTGTSLYWSTPKSLVLSRWDAATGEVTTLECPTE